MLWAGRRPFRGLRQPRFGRSSSSRRTDLLGHPSAAGDGRVDKRRPGFGAGLFLGNAAAAGFAVRLLIARPALRMHELLLTHCARRRAAGSCSADRRLRGRHPAKTTDNCGSRCSACRQGDRSFNPRQIVWPLSALAANGKSRPIAVNRDRRHWGTPQTCPAWESQSTICCSRVHRRGPAPSCVRLRVVLPLVRCRTRSIVAG